MTIDKKERECVTKMANPKENKTKKIVKFLIYRSVASLPNLTAKRRVECGSRSFIFDCISITLINPGDSCSTTQFIN